MGGEDLVLRFIGLDLLSNVAAAIGGKIDSVMRSIGSSGNELGKSFANVGKVAVGMGAGLLAVSAALTAVVVGTASAAATFEQKMTLLHTQAGAATSEVRAMTQAVLDIAPAVGFGPDKLADAMYHVESLGFRGAKALNLLEVAAKGAQIGNADLESTVNALGGVLVAEIGGVNNAAEAMAVLDATVGVGNMRMQDLVNALSTGVVPAGKNFGLTLQEINGALATLTDNAVPADEAATRLRMTFALIGAPTRQATKELATIGISQLQLATDMRKPNGLVVALMDLHKHLIASGKTAEEQSYIITRAFGGGRSSAGIMTLLNNLDRLNQRTAQITAMTGSFGERFAERAQNASFALSQLHATFERTIILIGTAVLPVFAMVVRAITPIITAIGTWVERHQRLTAMLLIGGIVVTALGGLFFLFFGMIALTLGGVLALVAAMPLIAAATTPILIAIGITLGVFVALVAAIIGVVLAIQHWEDIKKVAQSIWGFVGPYVMAIVDAISTAIHEFVTTVGVWWADHGAQVIGVWQAILTAIGDDVQLIISVVRFGIGVLLPFVQTAFVLMGDTVRLVFDTIVSVVRTALDTVLTVLSVALDLLSGNWGRAWDDLWRGVSRVWDDIVRGAGTFGSDFVNAIVDGITGLAGDVGNAVTSLIPDPLKKFFGIGNDIGTQVSRGIQRGLDDGKALIDRAADRGRPIAQPQPSITQSRRTQDVIPMSPAPFAPEPSGVQRLWSRVQGILGTQSGIFTANLAGFARNVGRIWQAFASEPVYWWGRAVGTIAFGASNLYTTVTTWMNRMAIVGVRAAADFVGGVGRWFSQLGPMTARFMAGVEANTAAWARTMIGNALRAGSGFINAIGGWFSQLPRTVGDPIVRTQTIINTWWRSTILTAQRTATEFVASVARAFAPLPGMMVEVGRSIVTGIWRGISQLAPWIGGKVGDFIRGLVDAANSVGRGGSPYMLFADEVGRYIVQGVSVGIRDEAPDAMRSMDQLMNALVSPRGGAVAPYAPVAGGGAPALGRTAAATAVSAGPVHVSVRDDASDAIGELSQMSERQLREIASLLRRIANDTGLPGGALSAARNG